MTPEGSTQSESSKKGRSPLYPKRPATEYALLGLLIDGPGHGYDLTRQFAADTELGKVCRLEMSMLYGLLKKLEREGLLNGKDEPLTEHKSRRIVELTPAGQAEFEAWLAEPVLHNREIRFSFLVKLYFARRRSQALVLQLLNEQIEFNQALLKKLLNQKQTAAPRQFDAWVVDFRLEQTHAALRWLTQCRYEVQGQSPDNSQPGQPD
ncbi:MAG: transcriptional regulator, PadR-like family [Chloroflexi bacterium]|jgi:DNA-binding PadR family transcriptional regulator|nr:transcriptional regulator, PadR-like family [Chloroflexota bacterium]